MKRPSFQFYPSDWLRDTALRSCSNGARGLWIDMICFMHEGNPYGYLKVGNKVILPANLARMVGLTLDEVEGYLKELSDANVYDVDEEGAICSRRMIRDENLRKTRAEGGKLGGNPKLKDNQKVNLTPNLQDESKVKQNPTPSSSSSSSSSIDKYSPSFEKFWLAYPKKEGKKKAFESWKHAKVDTGKLATILEAIERQKKSEKWTTENGRFIPMPVTWINQARWEDEVGVAPAQVGNRFAGTYK